jgi:hypothetical protein
VVTEPAEGAKYIYMMMTLNNMSGMSSVQSESNRKRLIKLNEFSSLPLKRTKIFTLTI